MYSRASEKYNNKTWEKKVKSYLRDLLRATENFPWLIVSKPTDELRLSDLEDKSKSVPAASSSGGVCETKIWR